MPIRSVTSFVAPNESLTVNVTLSSGVPGGTVTVKAPPLLGTVHVPFPAVVLYAMPGLLDVAVYGATPPYIV